MSGFLDMNFSDLMLNWMDFVNSREFSLIDNDKTLDKSSKNNGRSSGMNTLPKPKGKTFDSSNNSTSKTSTKKGKKTSKIKKPRSRKKSIKTQVYELNLKSSDEILMDLNNYHEGFDLHISQSICDDSRPTINQEAQSYFLMRHGFTYPGPIMTMLQGPMALTGGYGYRVSAEAVHRDKYILVATYQQNTIEGVCEYTWNENVKSHASFVAGFENKQQRQLQMMMGGGMQSSGPKFPTGMLYTDFKFNNFASRLHIDLMSNQLSMSLNRKITNNLSLGTKLITSYDARRSLLEFGFKYEYRNNLFKQQNISNKDNNNKNKKINNNNKSKAGMHYIEGSYNTFSKFIDFKYTHNLTDQCAFTSTLKYKFGTFDQILCGFGYKYQFGRHVMLGKTIAGEIASDGNFRQMITFPLLSNMMCKFYAEINHFLAPQQLQQGQFPHKFGFILNVHL
mmetsp:Transcript_40792/g.50262  ORF Transcript_40792/g.50262 Transcript_40792/m.50262 type:complete len:450 (+) Transcript_40792:55-1404(+)